MSRFLFNGLLLCSTFSFSVLALACDKNVDYFDELDSYILENIPPGDATGAKYSGCYQTIATIVACIDRDCPIGCQDELSKSTIGTTFGHRNLLEQEDGIFKDMNISGNGSYANSIGGIHQNGAFSLGHCQQIAGYYYNYDVCERYDGKFLDYDTFEGIERRRLKGTYTSSHLDCTEISHMRGKRIKKSDCM